MIASVLTVADLGPTVDAFSAGLIGVVFVVGSMVVGVAALLAGARWSSGDPGDY